MPDVVVSLTDAEWRGLEQVAVDPAEWIRNAVAERARRGMAEVVDAEVRRRLDASEPIPSDRATLVLTAAVEKAAERQARLEAEALARRQAEAMARGDGA